MFKKYYFLLPLFVFMFSFIGCAKDEQKKQDISTIKVGTIKLKQQEVFLDEELSGRVKASLTSEVRPQVNGIIKNRFFVEGSFVKKNDILYEIDKEMYQETFNQLKAALASAKANLEPIKLKKQRYEALLLSNSISVQDNDDIQAAYLQAQALVLEKDAAFKSAEINLERTEVKAPISGIIGISSVTKGALVTASQSEALATIRALDTVFVDLSQSSMQLLNLRKLLSQEHIKKGNTEVGLKLIDGSLYEHKGKLQLQEISVDESTGSVILRAEFQNPNGVLLPGMYVRAILQETIDTKAFMVPQQAVQRDAKANPIITVVTQNKTIEKKIIITQRAIGNMWLVTNGVTEDDEIIIEGLNKINDRSKVETVDVSEKYLANKQE